MLEQSKFSRLDRRIESNERNEHYSTWKEEAIKFNGAPIKKWQISPTFIEGEIENSKMMMEIGLSKTS